MSNANGAKEFGFQKLNPLLTPDLKVDLWAHNYAKRRAFCHEFFEGRSDIVIEQSVILSDTEETGRIQSLDICMQVEAEFPGKVEEIMDRAGEHPNGRLVGLGQYIRHLRRTDG